MYPIVTIEGSITPSVRLARGERRRVQLTDSVQRLIDGGFVTVVGEPEYAFTDDVEPAASPDELDEQETPDNLDAVRRFGDGFTPDEPDIG